VAIIFQVAFWTWLAGVIDDPDIDVGPYLPFGHNSDGFSVRAYIISTAPTAVLAPSAAAALLAIFLDHRGRWDEDGLMLRWCWRYAVLNALGSLTWPALIANYVGGPFVHSGIQVVFFFFLPFTYLAFIATGFTLLWCNVCKLRELSLFEEAHESKMICLTIFPSQLGVFGVAFVATQILMPWNGAMYVQHVRQRRPWLYRASYVRCGSFDRLFLLQGGRPDVPGRKVC
jgi:hypothetical protein